MTPEHARILTASYPSLLGHIEPAAISCDDGWFQLIDTLCRQIQWHGEHEPQCPPVVVRQIKEKLGGLRFYYAGGDDWIGGLVRMAEAISLHTCEMCGNAGLLNGLKTRCAQHAVDAP